MRWQLCLFASPKVRYGVLAVMALAWMLPAVSAQQPDQPSSEARRERARQFVAQRRSSDRNESLAQALRRARDVSALGHPLLGSPRTGSLTAAWQPLGPLSVMSASYGKVTGRVTAVAVDANDTTGNTVYVGTTGGGVWKSVNAAGPVGSVTFAPLTDVLPVFAANAGGSAIASLSIGAVAVQPIANPVVLAGTGDPNDATDSYYGEGILRSADGGLTWTLIQGSRDGVNGQHSFVGLGVAGFAWSTATPSLVVAAMSTSVEGALVNAANPASVPGLYYSADSGVTWQMASIYDGSSVVQQPQPVSASTTGNAATSVVWDALRQRFYAAVRLHGFYESADGVTWKRMLNQPGTGLTATACPVGANGAGSATCPLFRGALAVQAATGDLYALSVDSGNHDNGLWQDLCAATGSACANTAPVFAQRVDNGVMDMGSGSTVIAQGDYNLALAAAPSSSGTVLLAGTVDLYRCVLAPGSSGCSLRNTTNALNGCTTRAMVAPAQHALATMTLGGTPIVFVGNDGGLWRSLDGVAETGSPCNSTDAQHFDNLNGALGSLAEVTAFAQHPMDADTLLVGLGANGTAATTMAAVSLAGRSAWMQLSAGEGGLPLLDPNTPMDWYASIGAGVSLKQCTLGASCTAANFAYPASVGSAQVSGDVAVLDAPMLLDPALTTNLVTATCRVWRGPATGTGWSAANAISKPFGGGTTPCTAASPLVRSLAAGGPVAASGSTQNAGSTVIYAGLAGAEDGGGTLGGHLFMTTSAATATSATAWTDAALGKVTNDTVDANVFNPDGFDVSSVAVDAHDVTGATVYATIMGFGSAALAAPHVYRSTDFGQHWLNISANLPDAPANAVLVDPNDANTVYVAMDTGVYVTSAVATCATANCWSVYGTGLPNAPVTALAAAPAMLTGDGRRGMLRAGTYGRGLWAIPLLNAQNLTQPALTLSPASLMFGSQAVATQSVAQTITVTSSGNAPVVFTTIALTGDFTETDTCAGQTLAVGATSTVQVKFAPSITGTRSGTLTVYANVSGGQAVATLTGTATAPAAVVLTPVALTFAATVVNQTTAAQTVTIANTGGTASALAAPAISGDFSITANTCGATLGPQTACAVSVAFTPTASGTRTGTLRFVDDAGTQMASLTGVGNAPATDTLSATALSFATTQIGTSSASQQVTLTNAGDVALLLVSAAVTSGPFQATNTCGASLAAHASCSINVVFTPTVTGAASGSLVVSDQFRAQTVVLAGTAVAPAGVSLTPAAGLGFADTGVGLTTPAQTLTLTNNGGAVLAISSMTVSGDFHLATTTCGTTVQPAAACTLSIVFAPTVAGTRTGLVTLVDNAPTGSPAGIQTAALLGTGVDFSVAASGATSVTVTSGSSAMYPLLVTSVAAVSSTAALTCTGVPAHSTCVVSPANVTLSGTVPVTVTVQTGLAYVELRRPLFRWDPVIPVLALVVLPMALRSRRRWGLLLTVVCLVCGGLVGCGVGREIPAASGAGTSTPTPAGTYNLTVTAVAAGVTHSVGLTLVVK